MIEIINILSFLIFTAIISYYLAINLQWYSYEFIRLISKHHKQKWHVYYFILPIVASLILSFYSIYAFWIFLYIIYIPAFFLWYRGLDKKLIFTGRIKRFFALIAIFFVIFTLIDSNLSALPALVCGYISSTFLESMLLWRYESMAKKKLKNMKNIHIIAITASYGKTSIKNFIAQILSAKFSVYATPRSVNTHKGLIADINQNLDEKYQIYIAEAGARNRGDIATIARLLNSHYAIIGRIGEAHLEYFKNLQNIIETKFELLQSKNLKLAFVYDVSKIPQKYSKDNIISYNMNVKDVESTLDYTKFSMLLDSEWIDFQTNVLGRFNVGNIAAAILVAREFGVDISEIKKAVSNLKQVEHRLYKIVTDSKIILDDSFNGNLDGMSEAIRLSSLHVGRKVIVTPGLVESSIENNIKLAKIINEVFDLVIITGSLNAKILDENITREKILLDDKSKLQEVLASSGKHGDLVLFANDAPSYI